MQHFALDRRRAMMLLLLSSVLLLTIDVGGNPFVDRIRSGFSVVLTPFETAGQTIATPIRNLWHAANDYEELQQKWCIRPDARN